jgi:antitoxin component YwqK of YwqJK toxin-antitoxin module
MNTPERKNHAGVIQPKVLAVMACVLALGGSVALLIHRRTPVTPQAVIAAPLELSRTNLVLEAGRLRQTGSAALFAGSMVEHYPDGVLRSRSAVVDGLLHGLSEGWHTNAQLQVSEHFRGGVSHGERIKYYPDGTRQSVGTVVDGKLEGTFRRWHPNGQLAETAELRAGIPHGPAQSFYPSGYLKTQATLRDGKVTATQSWSDGERKELGSPDGLMAGSPP